MLSPQNTKPFWVLFVRPMRDAGDRLSAAETELLASYRKLPPKYQRRLREQAQEYELLARAPRSGGR